MTREYLQEPMAELGQDFDENHAAMAGMLRGIVAGVAEGMGVDIGPVGVESQDNGGYVLWIPAGLEQPLRLDLSDDITLRLLWRADGADLVWHIERRIERVLEMANSV